MSVSKKLLELKSNRELLSYIEEDNKYVPEANKIAYDVLINRGHTFDEIETNRIQRQILSKEASEQPFIHPHHVAAGNIIFFSAILGFANLILNFDIVTFNSNMWLDVMGLLLFMLMGYYAQRGSETIKYFFLLLFILASMGVIDLILKGQMNLLFNTICLVQCILQIWAVILLFRVPKRQKKSSE